MTPKPSDQQTPIDEAATHAPDLSRRSVVAMGAWGAAAAAVATTQGLFARSAGAQATLGSEISPVKFMTLGELPEFHLGNDDAPVTLIEYSSMTCPHCAAFHNDVLPEFKKKYIDTGKVKYIVREFPLDRVATAAFMLARCAGKEKFFPVMDLLYAKQPQWAGRGVNPVPQLRQLTKQAGFTKEAFDTCLRDQSLVDGILWTRARGAKEFGVKSTPTFFINGRKLLAEHDMATLTRVIDPLLTG